MARNAKAFLIDKFIYEAPAGAVLLRTFEKPDGSVAEGGADGMMHGCPCGCGAWGGVWFKGRGRGSAEWDVQGNWPNVTLSPSIGFGRQDGGGYHWHGFLRDGVFEEC